MRQTPFTSWGGDTSLCNAVNRLLRFAQLCVITFPTHACHGGCFYDGRHCEDLSFRRFTVLSTALALAMFILPGAWQADAQAQPSTVIGADVQKIANGVLTLMGFGLTPDVTTGSLSFSSPSTGTPGIQLSSLGGGFTISRAFSLYLEGTAAYSRYDTTFVLSDGTTSRDVPAKWNSLSATGGIGWDFPIARDLAAPSSTSRWGPSRAI
jgi:hypothetical protein